MVTRMYFPASQAAFVTPPSPGAEWEHNNGVSRALLKTPDASALATTAYTPDAADDLTNRDAMHRQYVSPRLKAQTISGNVTAQFQCLEAHANNQLFITIVVKVISEDGTTVRSTLLAITRATSLEVATSLTNRTFPSTAMGSYACTDGDRLLVEVGLAGNVTTAAGGVQGHNGSIRWGCSASGGDLAVNETETGTTFRPWIEFSNTYTFEDFPIDAAAGSDSITGQAATLRKTVLLSLAAGSYSKSGVAADLNYHAFPVLGADPASYGITGALAATRQTHLLIGGPGSYSEAGQNARALIGYMLSALAGSYLEVGGSNSRLLHGYYVIPLPGSYAITGRNASVSVGHLFAAMAGVLTISGPNANLSYSGGGVIVDGAWANLLGVGR